VQAAAELNNQRNRESKLHNRFKETRRRQRHLKYYGHYLYLQQRLKAIRGFLNSMHRGQEAPENWPVLFPELSYQVEFNAWQPNRDFNRWFGLLDERYRIIYGIPPSALDLLF
jgi:hypothetical protein